MHVGFFFYVFNFGKYNICSWCFKWYIRNYARKSKVAFPGNIQVSQPHSQIQLLHL